MATAVTTTVTELPESRVSVSVEVAAEEIQRSLESQARKLGREMKVPGFRTGKIPPAVVIQRIGREPILDEAVRGRLTDWYMKAVDDSGIAPVGDPDVDLGGTIDGEPFEGGEGRDQLVEVGAGRLIPGFDEGLVGVSAGEQKTVDAQFPDDYAAKHVAGKAAQFEFTVKEVKHKDLPELDDDFASDAAGYDTLDELRESIAKELLEHDTSQVENEFRAAALDAAVADATVDVPDALVTARAQELLDRMMHSLTHQGISKAHYLQISGKTEEELVEESKPDAEIALRREAVLAAIIEAEKIEPTEAELLDALEGAAEKEQMSRQKLLDRLRSAGRVDMLAKEVAAEQAIDLVVRTAKPVAPDAAPKQKPKAAAKKKPRAAAERKDKPAAKKKPAAKQQGDKGEELWTP